MNCSDLHRNAHYNFMWINVGGHKFKQNIGNISHLMVHSSNAYFTDIVLKSYQAIPAL